MEFSAPIFPWQAASTAETARRMNVDPTVGLDAAEAQSRTRFGTNRVTTPPGPGALRRLARQFEQPLVAILVVAAVIEGLLGQGVDAAVIGGVVLVNAVMGFLQESQARSALAALARGLAEKAMVLRNGTWIELPGEDLVLGDVVALRAGDKVPADLRLFSTDGLGLDESSLTGESVPADKTTAPVDRQAPLAEQTCLALSATLAVRGRGRGIVIRVGDATTFGRLTARMAGIAEPTTPLTRDIARFSNLVLAAILVLSGVTFAVGLWRGQAPGAMFMAVTALAVGAIPEGLPAAVTAILAMGAARLARHRAVIRHLPAVETLGAASVICTDKTGTLTENRMAVTELFVAGMRWRNGPDGPEPEDPARDTPDTRKALRECARAGLLCNDAADPPPQAMGPATAARPFSGDPLEAALLALAGQVGLGRADEETRLPRLAELPFAAERQSMATLHDDGARGGRRLFFKGSVDALLARLAPGPVRAAETATIREAAETMGRRGLRVLAFGTATLPPGETRPEPGVWESGLTFLGLAGLLDPPRPEAAQAVAACRRAGIAVKMITGDQASTAAAVAARVGLGRAEDIRVLTGTELAAVTDRELPGLAATTTVFARVSPEQKLRIITALRSLGQVTAMTGDGINDAPALRQADIGVAMGRRGCEAAREAANMVLTDDNFATLAEAVAEGRSIFDNLTKYIVWTLPTNLGEGLVILAAVFAGAPLPISPVQILWINMTTAGSLGLTLAFEPREPDIMARPPRDPAQPLLNALLVRRVLLVGAIVLAAAFGLHAWELSRGASPESARTVAVNVVVAVEALYLLNCRSLHRPFPSGSPTGNPWVLFGLVLTLGLQLLFTYAPFMHRLFGSAPLSPGAWLRIAGAALFGFLLVEAEKRLGQPHGAKNNGCLKA